MWEAYAMLLSLLFILAGIVFGTVIQSRIDRGYWG